MRTLNLFIVLAYSAILLSCNFNKSTSINTTMKLKTQGNGISCENITITDKNNKEFQSPTFIYGQEIFINFNNISGFVKENNYVFPGLNLLILSSKKDTVLYSEDLYANHSDEFNFSSLKLRANITLANPLHTEENYTAYLMIWDKKGTGTFKTEFQFNVIHNPEIKIKSKGVEYDEIYLFDNGAKKAITNNIIQLNQKVYILFEGLEGFEIKNDSVFCGISMKVVDKKNQIILDESDLMKDAKMSVQEFNLQVAPYFFVSDATLENPMACYCLIWDKSSGKSISAEFKFNVKKK